MAFFLVILYLDFRSLTFYLLYYVLYANKSYIKINVRLIVG